MKNLDLSSIAVKEMNESQMREIEGGGPHIVEQDGIYYMYDGVGYIVSDMWGVC